MIFAIDFDGTIVEHKFPAIGKPLPDALHVIRCLSLVYHHDIIIWTCRAGRPLVEMVHWLDENRVPFTAINSNIVHTPGFAVPKVLADVYLDDRSFPPFTSWADVKKEFCK